MTTKIEWAEESWNPVVGCSKMSEGCVNCYAEKMALRLAHMALADIEAGRDPGRKRYYLDVVDIERKRWNGKVALVKEALEIPLRWRRPRESVFCVSMGDLFHENVPDEFICDVFYVISQLPQHTFIVLTKRARRMREWFERDKAQTSKWHKPLSNLIGMVSVENQDQVWRIGELLKCPFAVRGVSCEPLLGPVDISDALNGMPEPYGGRGYVSHDMALDAEDPSLEGESLGWQEPEWQQTAPPLDWGIVGGESGPGARPMHPDWARRIRDQFQAAGKPFFFKQWGNGKPDVIGALRWHEAGWNPNLPKRGRLLDGREWNEWPEAR